MASEPVTVFQCQSCMSIVADSSTLLNINEEFGMIQLAGISDSVSEVGQLTTCTDGPDEGCAYTILKCSSCSSTLGRHYKGTTSRLDRIRNTYILFTETITRYQVGQKEKEEVNNNTDLSGEISMIKEAILSLASTLNAVTKAMINKGIVDVEDIEHFSRNGENEELQDPELHHH